jgi:tetratricopeptide (TPR) repeat protein
MSERARTSRATPAQRVARTPTKPVPKSAPPKPAAPGSAQAKAPAKAPTKAPAAKGTPKVAPRKVSARRPASRKRARIFTGNRELLILLGILIVAVGIYANSLANGFIAFDDPENVVDNSAIRSFSFANIGYWFSTPLQYMYTPLVSASYALDYAIGGAHPAMYHFTNLALHLANVALVYLVVRALTRRTFPAQFVAAVFAIHPMNVDGVAWIAATRGSLLGTLFLLGALLAYLRYLDTERVHPLVVSALLFLGATLSQSTAVVLPLILFAVDYYRGRRFLGERSDEHRPLWKRIEWKLVLEKAPFLLVALVLGIVALTSRMDTVNPHGYTVIDRFFLVCSTLVSYLFRLVWPVHLSLAYAYPAKSGGHLPWYFYASPLVLAAIGYALWRVRTHRRTIVFGLAFFVVTIVLSQSVLLIDNYKADRYAYLPYVGLLVIVAAFAEQFLESKREWRIPRLSPMHAFVGVLAIVALLFSTLTVIRNGVWRDTISITTDSIRYEPDVAFVYNSRGIAEYQANSYDAALADFRKTIEVDPTYYLAIYYQGVIKHLKGDLQGALTDLNTTMSHYPTFASGFNERGRTKLDLGDNAGALADLNQAIAYDPTLVVAYGNRGVVEINLGNFQSAIADLDTALSYSPSWADALYNRGVAKSHMDDTAGACADWKQAQQLGNGDATKAITTNSCP